MVTLSPEQSDKYLFYNLRQSMIEARLNLKDYKPTKEQLRGKKNNLDLKLLLFIIIPVLIKPNPTLLGKYFASLARNVEDEFYLSLTSTN